MANVEEHDTGFRLKVGSLLLGILVYLAIIVLTIIASTALTIFTLGLAIGSSRLIGRNFDLNSMSGQVLSILIAILPIVNAVFVFTDLSPATRSDLSWTETFWRLLDKLGVLAASQGIAFTVLAALLVATVWLYRAIQRLCRANYAPEGTKQDAEEADLVGTAEEDVD
ncbi:hypothetical protein LTR95_009688 [Oleoguttula sp. CCFEE 5521]